MAVFTSARIASAKMEGRMKWSPATRMRVFIMFVWRLGLWSAGRAQRRVVLQESGVFILKSDFGQRAIADRRKNRPVTRQRNTKQGAERQADERVMRDDQHAPVRVRGGDVAQS